MCLDITKRTEIVYKYIEQIRYLLDPENGKNSLLCIIISKYSSSFTYTPGMPIITVSRESICCSAEPVSSHLYPQVPM